MSDFAKYREDAIRHLELCEERYRGQAWARVPLNYARRWALAFSGEEVDLNALADIVRDAEREPGQYDIVFDAFLNDMRRINHELWAEFLKRQSEK